MKITFANQSLECIKAIRADDNATIYLADGGKAEFIGVSDFSQFVFEGGDWEIQPEPEPEPEATTEELLLGLAADHEYRISLQEMGLSESDLI